MKLTPVEFKIVLYQPLFSGSLLLLLPFFNGQTAKFIVIGRKCKSCIFWFLLFKLLTGNVQWTKTGTQPASTARVEPSSDVGNVGATFEATFETVARFSVKPPNQSITDIELNDASVGIKAQTMGVAATKNNANGMVLDHPPTNDNKLDHFASDVACQERREECPLGKTGTTIMCC